MTDYQIQAPTRRCAVSGRELRPGEKYHAALLDEAGRFVRRVRQRYWGGGGVLVALTQPIGLGGSSAEGDQRLLLNSTYAYSACSLNSRSGSTHSRSSSSE